ncbi:hypothetical protein MK163_11325, partial [bacterium]|nr:hypothetical protein [bacterium]
RGRMWMVSMRWAVLAAEDIAGGAPGPGAAVYDQEFVSVVEVADRLGPGRRVVGGLAPALEGVVDLSRTSDGYIGRERSIMRL